MRKYKGFSLIELLLTMMLMTVIMLLVSTTLNTVIKVSNTTNSKNVARADMNYIMDVFSRTLSNAELEDVYLYNSLGVRALGESSDGQITIVNTVADELVSPVYQSGILADETVIGNEVHIKLYGYSTWTCLGYFKDVERPDSYGYIVKSIYVDDIEEEHSRCFAPGAVVVPLHSFMVDASDFDIEYLVVGDGSNRMFLINATLDPLYWPVKNTSLINRSVSRQTVVSTQALTWY